MKDLMISLSDQPGALAALGEALGRTGVSVEGGGAWVVDGVGIAHFLVTDEDTPAARDALEAARLKVLSVRDVLTVRLAQDTPGQLGLICRQMAKAGVNIETLYSDHEHRLVLVVDDVARGREVIEAWRTRDA